MDIAQFLLSLPMKAVNGYYSLFIGGKNRPIYFDLESEAPKLKAFSDNFDTIKSELEQVEQLQAIPAYEELDQFQADEAKPTSKWKVFVLNLMGDVPETALEVCPKTCEMINAVPNVFQAFFSVLEPGRSIPAHKGPYMGYLRYHIGMKIPKVNPPQIRIHDTYYTWKEGESVLFDDSWEHEVINEATEERIVLIIDILRPMHVLPHLFNKFLTKFVIRHFYAKSLIKKNDQFFGKKGKMTKK